MAPPDLPLSMKIHQRVAALLQESPIKHSDIQPVIQRSVQSIIQTIHYKHKRRHKRQMQRYLKHIQSQVKLQDANDTIQECSICFELMQPSRFNLRQLPCGHTYHMDCIKQWVSYQCTCPCDRISFERYVLH